jgi:hypothetical protein
MSDGLVRAALERIEAWLADPAWEPDPERLAQWNADFQEALAQSGKGPGWSDLIARAHAAGHELEARLVVVAEARDRLKQELESQERGGRALKGYGVSAR